MSLAGYIRHKTNPQVLPLAVPLVATIPAVLVGLAAWHDSVTVLGAPGGLWGCCHRCLSVDNLKSKWGN